MALHPLRLPASAAHLLRIVTLQRKLLIALTDPALRAATIGEAWLQNVWGTMDNGWVRKFCSFPKKPIFAPLREIVGAPLPARRALYEEFRQQHRVRTRWLGDGAFQDINRLAGCDAALAKEVKILFGSCYALLSVDTSKKWRGYEFGGGRTISIQSYKTDFGGVNPPGVVCPYCDEDLGDPELDHYLAKDRFPFLSCSPWNLVPICRSCNSMQHAKGNRVALTLAPRSTLAWLHPLLRPATEAMRVRLNGQPRDSIPRLYSPNPVEQGRLDNHMWLLDRPEQMPPFRSLSRRWTSKAAAYYDRLVDRVARERIPTQSIDNFIQLELEDHQAVRGSDCFTLIHAAVCRAIIEHRPEYLQEFTDSNPIIWI